MVDNGSRRAGRSRRCSRPSAATPARSGSTPAPPSPARAANLGLELAERRADRADRRRRPDGLSRPAGHRAARRPARRPAGDRHHGLAPGPGPSHGGGRDRLRPGRRGRAARRRRLAGGRLPAVRGRHAGRLVRPGAGSARWARAARCSCRAALWASSAGSTRRSSCPAAAWSTTTSTAGPASWTAPELVVLLGEGTFHQFHGGAATSRSSDLGRDARRLPGPARRGVPATSRPTPLRRARRRAICCPTWTSRSGWQPSARLDRKAAGG